MLGVPFYRFIDIEDSEAVLRAIRLTDDATPIDLVLHTPGGLVLASEQIAYALRRHPAKVTVIVPHYAMSGGTLLALAADEILMDAAAVLGPVDPQLGDMPAASLVRVVEKKPLERLDDRTLVMADVAEKAVRHMKQVVRDSSPNAWARRTRTRLRRSSPAGTTRTTTRSRSRRRAGWACPSRQASPKRPTSLWRSSPRRGEGGRVCNTFRWRRNRRARRLRSPRGRRNTPPDTQLRGFSCS